MLAVVNAENLSTRLVFFTASVARGDIAAAIAAGACSAISMRERPETLLQSLRQVAPNRDRAPAGKEENGAFGQNVPAVLTDQERKIIRLVAQGLSNKAIARQLNVSPGTIKVHLNHIFQKLKTKNRTELAALALSQRYGGIGTLAALIFAAIDDVQVASHDAHKVTDTFTVMAADGTAEVVTIIINHTKDSAGASGTTTRAALKARAAANGATGTSISTGKLVDFGGNITANTFMLAAPNSARPSSGSYGTFLMAAAGAWIYELDTINSAAQAFDLGDSLTPVFASATASGTNELVNLNIPSSADANLDGSDDLALLNPGIYDRPFAFRDPRNDTIARGGDELQIGDADPGGGGANGNGKDNHPHAGSETINALIDHGGFGEASATDAAKHAENNTIQASVGTDFNRGQSQRELHGFEDSSAAGEQRANAQGDHSNRGQSQRVLHSSEDGSATAEQKGKHDATLGSDANPGQSQRDLHTAPVNASNDPHSRSSLNAGSKDKATDDAGKADTAAAPEFGYSFHFKNEMAASKASDVFEVPVRPAPDSIAHVPHAAGHDGPAPIQDADLLGLSLAQQNAVDHARGAEHYLTHDLIM
jgi:VCBS repeat-containing protein